MSHPHILSSLSRDNELTRNLFIAPPSYNECKPRGGGDSSSDEEEKNRRKAEKDSDEEGDESGARQSYAPRYMTYNTSDD